MSYITLSQVKFAMRSSYDGSDDALIQNQIIPAACDWLDKYTNRSSGGLLSQTYDFLMHGTGEKIMFLPDVPINTIERIATIYLPYLSIRNNDPDMGSRAYFQVVGTPGNQQNPQSQTASTGVTLTYIHSATTVTNTLLWTSYSTVNALVGAINALGNNWQANVMGGFGTASTTDLRATQGAYGCRITTGYVWGWWWEYPWHVANELTGEIYSPMGFARGVYNYRVKYTAGYTTFPNDLVQALAELCAATYYAREVNANLDSESVGPASYKQLPEKSFEGLSLLAKQTFRRYKRRPTGKFSTW